ncbi:tyrosine-type recombinase/integrase [Sulfurovum sp. CS9]|uniref:tyrosine-type recombinase/integrase n=1 Tax=Sulfurovum sp. CS9 TaxID=3391146 RepID=UPI0039ECA842
MTKTSKEGVYTRELNNGDVAYIITYRAHNKSYKRRLGTSSEGWSVLKAYQERQNRSKSFSKVETAINLEDAFEEYYRHIKNKSDTRNTKGRYYNHIHNELGDIPLNEIKPLDVLELRNKLSEKTSNKTKRILSPKTVDDMINLIHTIYQYYNKYHDVQIPSPASSQKVDRYNPDNSRRRYLTEKEIKELFFMIKHRNDFAQNRNTNPDITKELMLFTKIALSTGARLNSILTIKMKDIDFERGVVTITNHKAKRIYKGYIQQDLCIVIKKWCKDCNENTYIFGRSGKSKHPTIFAKRLQPILNKCFNEHVTDRRDKVVIHTLRHTFGSHLAIQGTPIYTIMKLLDHTTIDQTIVYAKLSPNQGQEEVIKLGISTLK